MKKYFLFAFIFSISLSSIAQETIEENDFGSNELRINALWLLLGSIQVSYDGIINDDSSFGIVIDKTFDKDQFAREYTISPFYRVYFSNKRARGFFFETNFTVYSEKTRDYVFINNNLVRSEDSEAGIGIGIGLGGKFLTNNGFVLEVYSGIGRAINNPVNINEIYGAAGITIGKRF